MEKPIIKKLKKIFKMGYIPSRGFETYEYVLPNSNVSTNQIGNCFTHACFNLKNEHFQKLKITKEDFEELRNLKISSLSIKEVQKQLCDIVSSTGLNIEECKADTEVKPNQWKVAFYFDMGELTDYHFLLQERNGTWTDKVATTKRVRFYTSAPKCIPHTTDGSYYLQGYLLITNPHATKEKSLDTI